MYQSRTGVSSLEGWHSTTELTPQIKSEENRMTKKTIVLTTRLKDRKWEISTGFEPVIDCRSKSLLRFQTMSKLTN